MTTYRTESSEQVIGQKRLTVVQLTPAYRPEERKEVHKSVEHRLYEVFRKYMPGRR